jgi:hypothetical protein
VPQGPKSTAGRAAVLRYVFGPGVTGAGRYLVLHGTYMAIKNSWWWMSGVSGSSTGQRLPRVDERVSALGREVVQYAVVDPAIQPPSEQQVLLLTSTDPGVRRPERDAPGVSC